MTDGDETDGAGAKAGGGTGGVEWWRTGPQPADAPPSGPEPPAADPGPDDAEPPDAANNAPGREWWRSADVRDELRETWTEHGQEGLAAAYEIGAHIGEAVAAHLPDPYAAAQRRGLDLRWLRLGLNIPALVLSLLVTWGGQSTEGRMTRYVQHEGLFAPLGWILLPVLLLGVLMVLPIGSMLGAAVGGLVAAVARGLVVFFRRAWGAPYIGYVLRLVVAVAAWSFAIALARLLGHIVINWLTGV